MLRTRTRIRATLSAVAIIALSGAAALLVAAPASAFASPGTFTFTPQHVGEDQATTQSIACPTGSTLFQTVTVGTQNGAPVTYGGGSDLASFTALDVNGEFTTGGFFYESFFDRGTTFTATSHCVDNSLTQIGADIVAQYTLPDSGMTAAGPASSAISAAIHLTGSCGSIPNVVGIRRTAFSGDGSTQLHSSTQSASGTVYDVDAGTATSYGVVAGESILFVVACIGDDNGTQYVAATRRALVPVVADAAVVADPATTTPAAGATLAATGVDGLPGGLAACALLLAGAALLIRRSQRTA